MIELPFMKGAKTLKRDNSEQIKRIRIKRYFIEAAKEIIVNEGLESISIRNVAKIAGYSCATIYNYFEDLNELLWEVKQTMIIDIIQLMQEEIMDITIDILGLKKIFKIYITYYLENPNIFKFFYFHKLKKPARKTEVDSIEPDFDKMTEETFKNFVIEGKLRETDIEVVGKTLIYSVHGMLTLFFTENGDLTVETLYKDLDKMIDYILI